MDKRDIGDPRKTGDSENRSCLNANKDMLKRANGWSWPEPNEISPVDELRLVVGCMLKWLRGQVCNHVSADSSLPTMITV